jgi:hypothetical protein
MSNEKIVGTYKAIVVGHTVEFYPGYERKINKVSTERVVPHIKIGLRVKLKGDVSSVQCPEESVILLKEGDTINEEMSTVVYNDLMQLHPFGSPLSVVGKTDDEGRWLEIAPPPAPPKRHTGPLTQNLGEKLAAAKDDDAEEGQSLQQ